MGQTGLLISISWISSSISASISGSIRTSLDGPNYAGNARCQGGGFADSGTGTGASAGTGENRFGVWSNFSGTGFSESQTAIQSSGQIYTFVAGADYRINDWVLAGLSAGYERQNITTQFNNGTWTANGGSVSPYFVTQLIPQQLFFLGYGSYVGNSIDITETNGANSGTTTGTRFMLGGQLQANLNYGNFNFRPAVGATWTYQGIGGYTESGPGGGPIDSSVVHFGQLTVGGQVGYNFDGVQPYLLANYLYDYKYDLPTVSAGQTQPIAYKNSALVGGGVLFVLNPRFSGGLEFSSQVGKTDYIAYTGSATVRYAF